jgi:Cof subfamily protein (haloacid dehalogenase superfamily)
MEITPTSNRINLKNYYFLNFKSKSIFTARETLKAPIKVVFSDIDGTILNANHKISNKNLTAIKLLERAKIPLIITTGRGYKAVDDLYKKLYLNPSFAITESGAVIIDSQKNKLYENNLSAKDVLHIQKIFNKLKNSNTYLRFNFDGDPYIENNASAFEKSPVKTYVVNKFNDLLEKGLLPTRAIIAKFDSESYETIEYFISQIKPKLADHLNIFSSGQKFIEITNKDVSKANAINFLQKYLNFEYKNIASIDDSDNDVSMSSLISQNGGFSVAMDNGSELMKTESRFITRSVDNDGFFDFVNEILQLNRNIKTSNKI